MTREDNSWILLVLFVLVIIFITVSITDNKYEPKQDYTVGRCVEWENITELDFDDCGKLREHFDYEIDFDELICRTSVKYTEGYYDSFGLTYTYLLIEIGDKNCISEFSEYLESINETYSPDMHHCYPYDEFISCTARMVTVKDW